MFIAYKFYLYDNSNYNNSNNKNPHKIPFMF